jgi:hypothetical protein
MLFATTLKSKLSALWEVIGLESIFMIGKFDVSSLLTSLIVLGDRGTQNGKRVQVWSVVPLWNISNTST